MITTLDIKGFKSVRDMHLDCKRINLFIGEPNTGKSNILEALGFLSWYGRGGTLRDFVRFDTVQHLFFDGIVNPGSWRLKCGGERTVEVVAAYGDNRYTFSKAGQKAFMYLDHNGNVLGGSVPKIKSLQKYSVKKRLRDLSGRC
jgi:AAA15 family ATPase/GTPase